MSNLPFQTYMASPVPSGNEKGTQPCRFHQKYTFCFCVCVCVCTHIFCLRVRAFNLFACACLFCVRVRVRACRQPLLACAGTATFTCVCVCVRAGNLYLRVQARQHLPACAGACVQTTFTCVSPPRTPTRAKATTSARTHTNMQLHTQNNHTSGASMQH